MRSASVSVLDVLLHGRHVGTLHRTPNGARFAYDEEVVAQRAGLPLLSTSLPVKARPYAEGRTRAWFEGLLPEGDRLDRICRELSVPAWDYMGILAAVGWECAGAVQVVAPGGTAAADGATDALACTDLAAKLDGLARSAGPLDATTRVSLGGYQDKLCVVASDVEVRSGHVLGGRWFLPGPAAVSTHIVKPQPRLRFAHLIEGEAWAMAVASRAARCARVALLELDAAPPALLVERFDRSARDTGGLVRVHQEDCCQALGLAPAQKYASARGPKGDDPTYRGIAALLDRYAKDPRTEKVELLRQMTVNLVLGNTDAHAKNYSFVYGEPGVPSLSPLYDVTPVVDIEPRATHLSMRVGGRIAAADVMRDDVVDEARSWGLAADEAARVLDDVLEAVASGVDRANEWYPSAAARHAAPTLSRVAALAQGA
jgi:serine/threonine-protein kinase HipA